MNFVYISPNFPENHWHFCDRLRKNGVTVLGIGDCPYDDLRRELKESLNEYYKVSSLENYDEVYRAVAFFIHKHGRIDYLESNNEYWLERDAALRQDFHIMSGFQPQDMPPVKCKSLMKDRYRLAGIPVALYHMVDDRADCLAFIQQVGYPVVAKPDNGVGANDTFRIGNEAELDLFFARRPNNVPYIMEEYIDGDVVSYDAIVNSQGEPIFETGNITLGSIMDIVNEAKSCPFMIRNPLPDTLRDMGRAAVKAFGVKKRFIHFEFFHLSRDQRIGKAGDFVALEVNMRPSGGVSPTMMNFANSTDPQGPGPAHVLRLRGAAGRPRLRDEPGGRAQGLPGQYRGGGPRGPRFGPGHGGLHVPRPLPHHGGRAQLLRQNIGGAVRP